MSSSVGIIALCLVAVVGCTSRALVPPPHDLQSGPADQSIPSDLSASVPDDLMSQPLPPPPDMSVPVDLAQCLLPTVDYDAGIHNGCAPACATDVIGPCIPAGDCYSTMSSDGTAKFCWANGVKEVTSQTQVSSGIVYKAAFYLNGVLCFSSVTTSGYDTWLSSAQYYDGCGHEFGAETVDYLPPKSDNFSCATGTYPGASASPANCLPSTASCLMRDGCK